jgi:hypothetical protein
MAAKGLSHEQAAQFMVALREGKTPSMFGTRRRDVSFSIAQPILIMLAKPFHCSKLMLRPPSCARARVGDLEHTAVAVMSLRCMN